MKYINIHGYEESNIKFKDWLGLISEIAGNKKKFKKIDKIKELRI